jgi:hypothetical protein
MAQERVGGKTDNGNPARFCNELRYGKYRGKVSMYFDRIPEKGDGFTIKKLRKGDSVTLMLKLADNEPTHEMSVSFEITKQPTITSWLIQSARGTVQVKGSLITQVINND